MFRSPEAAVPDLRESARRWAAVGRKDKEGWAWSNMGVALFTSGHMSEAAEALERSLVLFEEAGERNGKLAAQSFLALIRPEDPRVTDWLGDALRHAEEVGDRSGQCNARVLLAWHHTFRSYFGGPADIATADAYAQRTAELAAELHFAEFEIHGHCLQAAFARLTGRIDDAQVLCAAGNPLMASSPRIAAWKFPRTPVSPCSHGASGSWLPPPATRVLPPRPPASRPTRWRGWAGWRWPRRSSWPGVSTRRCRCSPTTARFRPCRLLTA